MGALLVVIIGGYSFERHVATQRPRVKRVARSRRRSLANRSQIDHYTVRPVHAKTQKINKDTPLWSHPRVKATRKRGNTAKLVRGAQNLTNLVQPKKIATAKHRPVYVQVSRQGRDLGWIDRRALSGTQEYLLPYVYTSQFWPSPARDACEIASLKTAMSTQHRAMHVSLRRIVKSIPRTNDPNRGYTHNPYRYSSHATIYPDAMVKVARCYGAHAKDITGAAESTFVYYVTHGQAVIFEGPYMMKKPGSDHDLVILGYRPHAFFVADPFARHHYSPKTTWVSTAKLMRLFDKPFRHQRALVVKS